MDNITWHIEPTSKCILECPSCDRTWFYQKFKKRQLDEINIDHLLNFFAGVPYTVSFCGNNGDPIYHSRFHELCFRLKQTGCSISITTNGSKKSVAWWEKLGSILTASDKIIFSIDGLEDTNKIYRINSDWNSIINGFNSIKKCGVKTIWKFIVFRHNQHQIEEAKNKSIELGFQEFQLEKSDRWWNDDLMPDKKYVDESYNHQISVTKGIDQGVMIKQKCMTKLNGTPNKGLYIDAEGNFYPCCKMGLYAFRYKHIFSPKLKKYNIKNNTIEQILNGNKVKDFFESTKSYETADKCCKIYCGVTNG